MSFSPDTHSHLYESKICAHTHTHTSLLIPTPCGPFWSSHPDSQIHITSINPQHHDVPRSLDVLQPLCLLTCCGIPESFPFPLGDIFPNNLHPDAAAVAFDSFQENRLLWRRR